MEETIRILLVEDDEVDRMAVRRALKKAGIQTEIATAIDCKSALAHLVVSVTPSDRVRPADEGSVEAYALPFGFSSPVRDAMLFDQAEGKGSASLTQAIGVTQEEPEQQDPVFSASLTQSDRLQDVDIATPDQQNFDCVLLDYRLPDGDALDLVQQVRSSGSKVPLIVLTGQGDEQIAVQVMKAGASDYLPKSKVSPETLARSVRNAVRIYRAEQEAALATQRLRESEERYRLVLEGSNDGIWDWDINTHEIYCNDRMYEIIGLSPTQVKASYDLFCQLLHPEDRLRVSQAVAAHLGNNVELDVEFRLLHACGEYRYCIARGKAWRDENGRPFRMSGVVSDISDRKRAEESQRFLAEASAILSSSLNYEKTLENLASLAVPMLADLCIVDIVEDNTVRRMGVAHAEPGKEEQLRQLRYRYPPDLNGKHPVIEVLRTGIPKLMPEITDEELVSATQDNEHLKIVREMGFKSYMIVPLLVRGRTLGTISLVSIQEGRRYGAADLALAEELARRAVLSIENGQLYHETQETSENLRQAILILGEQQQQLRTLQQLTNLLNQRLTDLPGLLREMVKSVASAIPCAQFCFIMLNNPQCDGLVLTVTAGSGTEKLRLEDAFSPKNGLLSRVFLTGESQLIQGSDCNLPQLEEIPATIYAVAIESVQAGRLGVLAIGNWEDKNAFDQEDQNLLLAVGEQAAIAIDNARMIKALEEQEARLENQNEVLADQNQELERQRQQLQLQNLQLLEAARLKSQFLATMSHELRTPMNAVIGFSQLLLRQRQNPLTSHQVNMVERILNNGKHLLALINEILDLSKIEAGRLELKLESFNLEALVRSTTDELRALADEKSLPLYAHTYLQNPNAINDSIRLRQILVNLLSNAIKFTEKGCVEVEVREINSDRLMITVKDTGIGISEDELDHIFEEFRQVDQTLTKKYPGTGLGLAITESLVQLMQGSITVESRLGLGSIFRIELPRVVQASAQSVYDAIDQSTLIRPGKPETSVSPNTSKDTQKVRRLY
jgi:two-component system, NarL family, sensor histidine kinase BarA